MGAQVTDDPEFDLNLSLFAGPAGRVDKVRARDSC